MRSARRRTNRAKRPSDGSPARCGGNASEDNDCGGNASEDNDDDPYNKLPLLYPNHPNVAGYRDFSRFIEVRPSTVIPENHPTTLRRGAFVSASVPNGKIPTGAVAALYRGDRVENDKWDEYDRQLCEQAKLPGGETNVYCMKAQDPDTERVLFTIDGRGQLLDDPTNTWRYRHLDINRDPHNVSKFINASSDQKRVNVSFSYYPETDEIEVVTLKDILAGDEIICHYGEDSEEIISAGASSSCDEGGDNGNGEEREELLRSASPVNAAAVDVTAVSTANAFVQELDPMTNNDEAMFAATADHSVPTEAQPPMTHNAAHETPSTAHVGHRLVPNATTCLMAFASASAMTSAATSSATASSAAASSGVIDDELVALGNKLQYHCVDHSLTREQKIQLLFKQRIFMAIVTSVDAVGITWDAACVALLQDLELTYRNFHMHITDVFDVFRCLVSVPGMARIAFRTCTIAGIAEHILDTYHSLMDDLVVAISNGSIEEPFLPERLLLLQPLVDDYTNKNSASAASCSMSRNWFEQHLQVVGKINQAYIIDSEDRATNRSLRLHDYFITKFLNIMDKKYCDDILLPTPVTWTCVSNEDEDEDVDDSAHVSLAVPRHIRRGGFGVFNFERKRVTDYFFKLLRQYGHRLVNPLIMMCVQKWPALCPFNPIDLLLQRTQPHVESFIWSRVLVDRNDRRFVLDCLAKKRLFLQSKHKRLRDTIDIIDLTSGDSDDVSFNLVQKKQKAHLPLQPLRVMPSAPTASASAASAASAASFPMSLVASSTSSVIPLCSFSYASTILAAAASAATPTASAPSTRFPAGANKSFNLSGGQQSL